MHTGRAIDPEDRQIVELVGLLYEEMVAGGVDVWDAHVQRKRESVLRVFVEPYRRSGTQGVLR